MSKITKQNVGGTDYTMVGCALTGACASQASDYVKVVTLSDGDEISDGMTVVVNFANGNTAGNAPASQTIYSSDQVNYYSDSGLTQAFTLAPAGCYTITYTGEGNAYTYQSYPVMQIGNVTGIICDASGNVVSGSLWATNAQVSILFKDGKFLLVSGALLNNLSALPKDAMLHYSFDDVPDLPDGTADVKYPNGNTYDVPVSANGQVTTDPFASDDKIHKSNVNGNANYKADVSSSNARGVFFSLKVYAGKIVIFDVIVKTPNIRLQIEVKQNEDSTQTYEYPLGSDIPVGRYRVALLIPSYYKYTLCFYSTGSRVVSYTEWELTGFYVGYGSYRTPIIDNSGNNNNAVNNGGLPVSGMSGKGAYFLSGKYADLGTAFQLEPNFAISVWVKPDNSTTNLNGTVLLKSNVVRLANGMANGNNSLLLTLVGANSTLYSGTIGELLDTGKWTHLAIVRDGTSLKVYRNGVYVRTQTLADGTIKTGSNAFTVSEPNVNRPQTIDDLLIFNRALSTAEVQALYLNKGNTPKYYDLNNYKLPSPPSSDGTYSLQCKVVDGASSYSWENDIWYKDFSVDLSYDAGDVGSRGGQVLLNSGVPGYTPINAMLFYITDSSKANVMCFFGNSLSQLYVNSYRTSASAQTVSGTVRVFYRKGTIKIMS